MNNEVIRFDGKKGQTEQDLLRELDRPGAGLPFVQRVLLRYFFAPLKIMFCTWERAESEFAEANRQMLAEIQGLTESMATTRVLIAPVPFIEDSSRYWSVAMTLRHLIIVGETSSKMIAMMSQEQVVPIAADVARVKPEEVKNTYQTLEDYCQFCAKFFY